MSLRRLIPTAALLAVVPVLAWALGDYQGGLLAQYAMYGVAVAALSVSWGLSGILNLGHAVSFGVGAYTAAIIGANGGTGGVLLGLLAGAAAAGVVALLIALVGLRGWLDPVVFALLTFVVLFGAVQVASQWTAVTGGYNGMAAESLFAGRGGREAQRIVVAVLGAVLTLALAIAARSPFGALLTLVRDNPLRAATLGYNVPATRIAVFTVTGVITGLAGGLFVTQTHFVSPDEIGLALATNFVMWAMIGSQISPVGGFVAAVIMSFVATELSDALQSMWLLAAGLIFLAVVVFLPEGLTVTLLRLLPSRLRPVPRVELTRGPDRSQEDGATLEVDGIVCSFGSFVAVDHVDARFEPGAVHCLIGPNGAGKSTLLNAISATRLPTSGSWRLGETDLGMARPWVQTRHGMTRKFQAPSTAPALTVAQNVALAVWGPTVRVRALLLRRWRVTVPETAWRIMTAGGLHELVDVPASDLSHGQRQMLELAMVFATRPRAVLLDEPTAGMTKIESADVAPLIRDAARELRIPIVVVEHDMSLIRTAATTVTVLRSGRVIAHGTVAEIEQDAAVQDAYLGGSHR